ncbi:MAG TPA: hypothetical protein VLL76_02195, partial [Candidatus Omnitrophota bacterium]|nr:hypothetical protein [Candidatus Omnitrophota bacterium]
MGGIRGLIAVVAAVLLLCGLPARAQVLVSGAADRVLLDGHLEFLEGDGAVAEVTARAFEPGTRPGLAPGVVWYRFTVRREAGTP